MRIARPRRSCSWRCGCSPGARSRSPTSLSGVAVAAALLVAFPPDAEPASTLRLSPSACARLAGYVVAQLVTSNIVMAREILAPAPTLRPGVLAHRLQRPSEEVVTLMTSVIALSPGTMTVDVDRDSTTIYVHFLFLDDVDAARASLDRLEQLVVARHRRRAASNRHRRPAPEEST